MIKEKEFIKKTREVRDDIEKHIYMWGFAINSIVLLISSIYFNLESLFGLWILSLMIALILGVVTGYETENYWVEK